MWVPFRYQGSCEKTILTLYSSQKLRNRGFRNRIDFLLNSASIRGTFSAFFHVFSVYFFSIDFRIAFFLDFVWIWELPGRPVRPRWRPGSATSDPRGHPDGIGTRGPGDARGGLGSRPWSNITNFYAFPWAVPRADPTFTSPISLIFDGFGGRIFMFLMICL